MVKFPNVKVKLTGQNGNIFNLAGLTVNAMKKKGISQEDRDLFTKEIMDAETYYGALAIIQKTVMVS